MKKKGLKEYIKNIDLFGHNVSVKYQNESSHKTLIGAAFSIAIYVLMFIYIYINVKKMVKMEDNNINSTETLADLEQFGEVEYSSLNYKLIFYIQNQKELWLGPLGIDMNKYIDVSAHQFLTNYSAPAFEVYQTEF